MAKQNNAKQRESTMAQEKTIQQYRKAQNNQGIEQTFKINTTTKHTNERRVN